MSGPQQRLTCVGADCTVQVRAGWLQRLIFDLIVGLMRAMML